MTRVCACTVPSTVSCSCLVRVPARRSGRGRRIRYAGAFSFLRGAGRSEVVLVLVYRESEFCNRKRIMFGCVCSNAHSLYHYLWARTSVCSSAARALARQTGQWSVRPGSRGRSRATGRRRAQRSTGGAGKRRRVGVTLVRKPHGKYTVSSHSARSESGLSCPSSRRPAGS